jgi:hypothetical protein
MERLACFAEQRMDRVALDEALERRRQVISSELYKLQLQPAAVRAPQYQKPPPPPTQQQQQQQRVRMTIHIRLKTTSINA